MTYDITPIVQAVFALVAAIITAIVIPWIKFKTTSEQQDEIKQWVKIAVAAAEQIFVGQGRGEEKKTMGTRIFVKVQPEGRPRCN
jgi:hypothetical protein